MRSMSSVVRTLPRRGLPGWGLITAIAALPVATGLLPTAPSALLLAAFLFIGPGSLVVDPWSTRLPKPAVVALVPVVSVSVVVLVVTLMLFLGAWSPRLTLLALCAATAVAAVWRLRRPAAVTR